MTLFVLYLLAGLDGLLCGCRAEFGRCPLIHKMPFYFRAVFRGLIAAQFASFISLLTLLIVLRLSSHPALLRADLESAAGRMLWVFVPYALAVISTIALRLIPSVDIRSATSVVALGPLTAIRPFLMIAGVLYGIWHSQLLETRVLGLFVLAAMLFLELTLNLLASRRQLHEIAVIVGSCEN
jgi:hypothetical protein